MALTFDAWKRRALFPMWGEKAVSSTGRWIEYTLSTSISGGLTKRATFTSYIQLISLTYVCSMSKNTSITNTFNTIGRLNPTPPPPHPSPLPIRSLSRFPKHKSLDGMLVHRQVTTQLFIRLPWPLAGTWVERSTVRVKYLAKEHNTVTWPGVKKQNTNIKNWTLRISELNLANSCIIFN